MDFRLIMILFLAPFHWRYRFAAGVWRYDENTMTGRRRAVRAYSGGYSPLDATWLARGVGSPIIIDDMGKY